MSKWIWFIRVTMGLVIGGGLWHFLHSQSLWELIQWGLILIVYPTLCVFWMWRLEQIEEELQEEEQIRTGIDFPPS